jgi:hypothetical protein
VYGWELAPGDIAWRVVVPTHGATNAGGRRALSGTAALRAGASEVLVLDPDAAR